MTRLSLKERQEEPKKYYIQLSQLSVEINGLCMQVYGEQQNTLWQLVWHFVWFLQWMWTLSIWAKNWVQLSNVPSSQVKLSFRVFYSYDTYLLSRAFDLIMSYRYAMNYKFHQRAKFLSCYLIVIKKSLFQFQWPDPQFLNFNWGQWNRILQLFMCSCIVLN